ncbi:MAG: FHA domain-containing protein [Clostridia bacterium]|nr:FHA domain-containing protein [Clostridia bacterium]
MQGYELVSSILSYVFTTIIYIFIFAVVGLVYLDIKKMNTKENETKDGGKKTIPVEDEDFAILRTVKSRMAVALKMNAAYRISGKGVVVGRGKKCDIIVNDMYLSAAQFQIWSEDGKWYIRDMDSKNGTYLNGSRLKKIKQLKTGCEIAFGELKFLFEEED